MLKPEKYSTEIMTIAMNGSRVAIVDDKPVPCGLLTCNNCDLSKNPNKSCKTLLKEWANSEYTEMPKLTNNEFRVCELLEYGWIARDKNNQLHWYNKHPKKMKRIWMSNDMNDSTCLECVSIFSNVKFDFIQWEDENPWAIEELLKLEVE